MTIQESTICSLVQTFPILLILAQNNNKCLKTPLVYKPPTPTPSPEYYEALDALFQSLYGHGYHSGGHHDRCPYGPGHYGKKSFGYSQAYYDPCHTYTYPPSHEHQPHSYGSGYGAHSYGAPGYGTTYTYPSYHQYSIPNYGYKKVSIYNLTGNHGYKSYAPTQVYNMNHKYKVVVKRNKNKIHNRRKPQKLQSFFDRENRRYPPQDGFPRNLLSNFRDRVTSFLQQRPNQQGGRPVVTPNQHGYYDEYGRPVHSQMGRPQIQQPVWNNQPEPSPGQNDFYLPENMPVFYNPENTDINSQNIDNNPENTVNFSSQDPVQPPEETTSELTVNFPDAPPELPELTPAPELPQLTSATTKAPFTSAPEESSTGLPELTPVPTFETRKNFNFEPAPVFLESCEVEGYRGHCIQILNCEPYVRMLQQSKSNPAVAQLLRKAHCGFEGNYPKVCCPIPGIPDQPPPSPPPEPTPAPAPTPAPTAAPTAPPAPQPKADQSDGGDYVSSIPEPPICGSSNATFSRVVGGVDAKLGDFPWMALLGYKKARGNTDWLCGGSLISSKHVLTASHCIYGHEKQLYVVRLGELDLAKEDEGATPVDVLIKKQVMHEEYNSNTYVNDIAVLVLERDVEFTHLIRPICIPTSSELRANTFENYNPIVAGWGSLEFRGPSAQILQALQLPVVSNDFCRDAYKAYTKHVIDNRVLCAGYKKGGKDACQGDSGGPLMQPIWNKNTLKTYIYQIGVVSFGKKCAEPGFPGVYSRVTTFVPWLEEKLLGPAK